MQVYINQKRDASQCLCLEGNKNSERLKKVVLINPVKDELCLICQRSTLS